GHGRAHFDEASAPRGLQVGRPAVMSQRVVAGHYDVPLLLNRNYASAEIRGPTMVGGDVDVPGAVHGQRCTDRLATVAEDGLRPLRALSGEVPTAVAKAGAETVAEAAARGHAPTPSFAGKRVWRFGCERAVRLEIAAAVAHRGARLIAIAA